MEGEIPSRFNLGSLCLEEGGVGWDIRGGGGGVSQQTSLLISGS